MDYSTQNTSSSSSTLSSAEEDEERETGEGKVEVRHVSNGIGVALTPTTPHMDKLQFVLDMCI